MVEKVKGLPCSNWEFAAFYLIDPFVGESSRRFFRTQVFNSELIENEVLELLTGVLGHKKNPRNPHETLQRTLQNMRDKGWVSFLDNMGNYELTDQGWQILASLRKTIGELRPALKFKLR